MESLPFQCQYRVLKENNSIVSMNKHAKHNGTQLWKFVEYCMKGDEDVFLQSPGTTGTNSLMMCIIKEFCNTLLAYEIYFQ